MAARLDNGRSVICGNLRNLRTIEKAGTKGPLITLITRIMNARNQRMARACGVSARYLNGPDVICGNLRNLRTIEKAGTKGPLITLITLIMDARNLCVARACGIWPQD